MKVVLDTNILASGIFWKGSPSLILEMWTKGTIQVFTTLEMLQEYRKTLEDLDRLPEKPFARNWLLFAIQNSTIVSPKTSVKICRDADDDKILDCAIAADAKFIISGDKDLLTLVQVQSIRIVSPTAFLKILKK